jgi:hypothetical protein
VPQGVRVLKIPERWAARLHTRTMGGSDEGPPVGGEGPQNRSRPPGGGEFTVPDDASSLDADRLAWLAEHRAQAAGNRAQAAGNRAHRRFRNRLRRMVPSRRHDRFGTSGSAPVVMCLAVVTLVGALFVVAVPCGAHPSARSPSLAHVPPIEVPAMRTETSVSAPSVEVSAGPVVGRRLPTASLTSDVGPLATPALRPAVILLVSPSCGCAAAIRALYRQAQPFRLTFWIVSGGTSASDRAQLVRLDEEGTAGGAHWAQDGGAVLHRALRAGGLTVVLVAPDGVVSSVVRNIPAVGHGIPALELVFALLASPPE